MRSLTPRSAAHALRAALALAAVLAAANAQAKSIELLNVSYDPTRELYVEYNAAFTKYWKAKTGDDVVIRQSHGGSGAQARSVIDGLPADVVTLALAADIDSLHTHGDYLPVDWQSRLPDRSTPYTSTIVLLVRAGNPKNIRDWDDLLRPGVEVITPSPLSSGSAKWNLLAPYVVKSGGGHDSQAGLDFIHKLVNEHVKLRPGSGREATDVFVQGSGDVLISYENEAIATERQGKPVTHINPPQTIKIENPVAVVTSSPHLNAATAFKNFLYTAAAQKVWAAAGFRPVDPAVAAEVRDQFPTPAKLWRIADLGGWAGVDKQLFDKSSGSITKIYTKATG